MPMSNPGVRMTRKWKVVLALAAVAFVSGAAYLLFRRPVLLRLSAGEETYTEFDYTIFNPFRDTSPERCAVGVLQLMKARQCEQAMSGLEVDEKYRDYICGNEREYPMTSWRLRNRRDEPNKVRMFYWVRRNDDDGVHGRLWITAERRNGQWQATDYSCIY
jgi:hypothetical protein